MVGQSTGHVKILEEILRRPKTPGIARLRYRE
jgi:hypothetical protein